jgi:predicted nucleotide-binding protein
MSQPERPPRTLRGRPRPGPPKVFIVHGLEPVILHEQPDRGRTIIDKFEAHADVAYAVVLLTADDFGGPAGGQRQSRARQNVIFEPGYFVGRLGRAHVSALYEEGVELPSDFEGVLYVPLARDAWRQRLAREMKVAGLPVDMNNVPL